MRSPLVGRVGSARRAGGSSRLTGVHPQEFKGARDGNAAEPAGCAAFGLSEDYAFFLAALIFAQRAFWNAAIFARAAALIFHFLAAGFAAGPSDNPDKTAMAF